MVEIQLDKLCPTHYLRRVLKSECIGHLGLMMPKVVIAMTQSNILNLDAKDPAISAVNADIV